MAPNPPFDELVDTYTDHFGQAPGIRATAELENLYARHPAITRARLDEAADAHTAGRLHSPWGFVLTELRRHDNQRAAAPEDIDREQERAVHLAENYIRTAGIYLPTQEELLDELFGKHGKLRAWKQNSQLQQRLSDLWKTQRPYGIQSEQEQTDRANRWRLAQDRRNDLQIDQDWSEPQQNPHDQPDQDWT